MQTWISVHNGMSSPLIFPAARHLMSFVMDANYAYQFIPNISPMLQVGRKKNRCEQNLGKC